LRLEALQMNANLAWAALRLAGRNGGFNSFCGNGKMREITVNPQLKTGK
jgi:hypothetical protein